MRLKQTYGRRRKRYATWKGNMSDKCACSVTLLDHLSAVSHDCGVKGP